MHISNVGLGFVGMSEGSIMISMFEMKQREFWLSLNVNRKPFACELFYNYRKGDSGMYFKHLSHMEFIYMYENEVIINATSYIFVENVY